MEGNRFYYEFLRRINPILPSYEVFDKYKDDIEGLAAYMINEHPDKKDDIEKIVKQLIKENEFMAQEKEILVGQLLCENCTENENCDKLHDRCIANAILNDIVVHYKKFKKEDSYGNDT